MLVNILLIDENWFEDIIQSKFTTSSNIDVKQAKIKKYIW